MNRWVVAVAVAGGCSGVGWAWDTVLSRDHWMAVAEVAGDGELVDWLRDDSIRWNATAAASEILDRLSDPQRHATAMRTLEAAFEEAGAKGHRADEQFFDALLGLLQEGVRASQRDPAIPAIEPSEALLHASIGPAALFEVYSDFAWIPGSVRSRRSLAFLLPHAPRIGPKLVEEMRRREPRSRPRSNLAFLVAHAGGVAPVEEVAEILIADLVCNRSDYDALMGIVGLWRMGPAAAGPARRALERATDPQQRRSLELLLAAWDWPLASGLRAEAAERLHRESRLSWRMVDPLDEWSFSRHSGCGEAWPEAAAEESAGLSAGSESP